MKYIAHRGIHSRHTENSREAVLEGLRSPADGVEVDLRILRDGAVVLHHDGTIRRITDNRVRYHDLQWLNRTEFESLIPFNPLYLPEALSVKPAEKTLILECKPTRNAGGFCRHLSDTLSKQCSANVLLSSFSWDMLRQLRMRTGIPTAPVVSEMDRLDESYLKRIRWDEVHLHWDLALDNSLRSFFQKHNIPVVVWTVNEREKRDTLEELGIDGIMTDNEALFFE